MTKAKLKSGARRKILAVSIASIFLSILWVLPANAQVNLGMDFAASIGLSDKDIREIVGSLIRSLLGLVGMIMVVQIMWGGFLMMTHGGNEDAKDKAVATITNSIVGFFIMMISFSAAKFVINAIGNATGVM